MSPRTKSHHNPSSSTPSPSSTNPPHDPVVATKEGSKPRKTSTTAAATITTTSRQSSIPTLPDVHKAPSTGLQGNFLYTLLAEEPLRNEGEKTEDEEEKEREMRNVEVREGWTDDSRSSSSSRSVGVRKTKGKVTKEGYGHRLNIPERSTKRLSGETLTARSDKILTASWAGAGDVADHSRGGQRRRHSRDNGGSSARSLSGPLPSKKKAQHRLSHGSSPRQLAESQRRPPSPVMPDRVGPTKTVDLSHSSVDHSVIRDKEGASSTSARPISDAANISSHSEKRMSESTHASSDTTKHDAESEEKSSEFGKVLPSSDGPRWDSKQTPSGTKIVQTSQTEKPRHAKQTASVPATHMAEARNTDSNVTPLMTESGQVTNAAMTPLSPLTSSIQPSEPFNQWTTCRALEDTDDENDDGYDDDESLGTETDAIQDLHHVDPDSSTVDGRFSRLASSNPTRRKRPLLLPPIMLPPVYTMKPTPFILRDDVYFASAGSRARRPITDAEWDKLRDCRYLRIRTLRRPLKVK